MDILMSQVDFLIKVTKLPKELSSLTEQDQNYRTAEIYKMLRNSGLLWRVWLIDQYGKLWVEVNFINHKDEAEFHTIAIDEGTYEKVHYEPYVVINDYEKNINN